MVAMCNWLAEKTQTSDDEQGNDCKLARSVLGPLERGLVAADESTVFWRFFGHCRLIATLPKWD